MPRCKSNEITEMPLKGFEAENEERTSMVGFVGQIAPDKDKLNQKPSKAIERKSVSHSFLWSHLPPGLQSMGDFALSACLFTGSMHFQQAAWERAGAPRKHTLKEERFEIGEPAELQIGHIGDAIVTQMQHLQALHQWLQTDSGPSFP